jgi:hypothetical protein
MRTLIFLALVLLVLAMVGWVTFSRNGAKTSINLETGQMKHDTNEMIDSGRELVHKPRPPLENPNARPENAPASQPVINQPPDRTPPPNDGFTSQPVPVQSTR